MWLGHHFQGQKVNLQGRKHIVASSRTACMALPVLSVVIMPSTTLHHRWWSPSEFSTATNLTTVHRQTDRQRWSKLALSADRQRFTAIPLPAWGPARTQYTQLTARLIFGLATLCRRHKKKDFFLQNANIRCHTVSIKRLLSHVQRDDIRKGRSHQDGHTLLCVEHLHTNMLVQCVSAKLLCKYTLLSIIIYRDGKYRDIFENTENIGYFWYISDIYISIFWYISNIYPMHVSCSDIFRNLSFYVM